MSAIAIDAMSGDRGPGERVAGSVRALQADPDLHLHLVGDASRIEPLLHALSEADRRRIELVPASEVVEMHEHPREAIRRKKHSSMRVCVDLVKAGRAAGCVSAGNTGALTAISHFVLKTIAGVERAAIMSAIPSAHGHTHMLDLGANTGATPSQLAQFAVMGSIVARDVYGIATPRVGLLNIGEEDIKGHEAVQQAHALLARRPIHYVGFVEGDDIFSGEVDVVVTDGFTGNVALKTMEGVAGLIAGRLKREFGASLPARVAGLIARPVLRRAGEHLDPRRYNGACMVGLAGVVVKSHGSADALAFSRAVSLAALAARRGLTGHIAQALTAQGS
ncbi:MAG: phosphate acyltransferase PlsX [Steroidobacteraceae bacterium]